jgi:hypothetical protein
VAYEQLKQDAERLAQRLMDDLKSGSISKLDRDTIERACDIQLAETGRLSADNRATFVDHTWWGIQAILNGRVLARAG